jgi:hypothetical protein
VAQQSGDLGEIGADEFGAGGAADGLQGSGHCNGARDEGGAKFEGGGDHGAGQDRRGTRGKQARRSPKRLSHQSGSCHS